MTITQQQAPRSANIYERLRSVPADAVLRINTPNPLGVDTQSIPVGSLCHEAAQYIEQSTAQPQAVVPADQRPVNCGTGHCSCIECVVEPSAQAERAPVVQAVQASPEPLLAGLLDAADALMDWCVKNVKKWNFPQWGNLHHEVQKHRASSGATPAGVQMLTPREIELLREIRIHAQFGCLNEGWQRDARNLLLGLEEYYRAVNAGKRIPADGVIGGV